MRARDRAGAAQLAVVAGLWGLAVLAAPAAARPPDVVARTPIASPQSRAAATGSLSAAGLGGKLGGLIRGAGAGGGAWVYDAASDRALFGFHANRRRILASNTKLFTTATALDRLGADRRLETSVWASGLAPDDGETPSEEVAIPGDGTIDGDLYLVGDGDPALGSPSFGRRHNLPVTRSRTSPPRCARPESARWRASCGSTRASSTAGGGPGSADGPATSGRCPG